MKKTIVSRPTYKTPVIKKSKNGAEHNISPLPPLSPPIRGERREGGINSADVVDEVKEVIERMSTEDRKVILDYLLFLQQESKPTRGENSRDLDMWKESILSALGSSLGNSQKYFPKSLNPTVTEKFKEVQDFLRSAKMEKATTAEKKLMFTILARVLVANGKFISTKAAIPLSLKLVLQGTSAAPVLSMAALFDQEFPGYLKSGLVHTIINAAKPSISTHHNSTRKEQQ